MLVNSNHSIDNNSLLNYEIFSFLENQKVSEHKINQNHNFENVEFIKKIINLVKNLNSLNIQVKDLNQLHDILNFLKKYSNNNVNTSSFVKIYHFNDKNKNSELEKKNDVVKYMESEKNSKEENNELSKYRNTYDSNEKLYDSDKNYFYDEEKKINSKNSYFINLSQKINTILKKTNRSEFSNEIGQRNCSSDENEKKGKFCDFFKI